jgi:hypothetical protein
MSNNNALLAVLIISSLLLGGLVAFAAFPRTVTEKVNVPGPVVKEVVNQTVEKIVVQDKSEVLLADAKSEYLAELKDDDDYLICDGEQYDLDQVTFRDVKDLQVSTDTSDRKDTVTTVSYEQPLKFSDKDVESKCYRTDLVEVVFHSDAREDTEIEIA